MGIMSAIILFSITTSILLLLPLIAQPLRLGLAIMVSTILICLLTGMFLSSWYGFILFLIYVGGLLVIFAYVATLSPNTLFGGAGSLFFLAGAQTVLPLGIYYAYFPDTGFLTNPSYNLKEMGMLKRHGIELVSPIIISILISLALILLINLVVVVKICYYQQSALRPYKSRY